MELVIMELFLSKLNSKLFVVLVFSLLIYNPSNSFVIAGKSDSKEEEAGFVEELDYGLPMEEYYKRSGFEAHIPPATIEVDLFYVGCYDAWDKNTLSYMSTAFIDENNLESCKTFCGIGIHSFVLVRGKFCACMKWENFQNTRVSESYCDVRCPGDDTKICGGSHEFSVYCNNGDDGSCADFEIKSISNVYDNGESNRHDTLKIDPVYSCINCANNIYACVQSGISPSYDYVPDNSASTCMEYCGRPVSYFQNSEEVVRQPTKYALAGWDTRVGQFGAMPISICKCSDTIFDHFLEVDVGRCTKTCPDIDELCGGPDKGVFTVYCANPEGCLSEIIPTTTQEPKTTADSTMPAITSKSTILPTDGFTSKPTPVPTDGITTESTGIITTNPSTIKSTETTRPSTTPSSTSTTTPTPVISTIPPEDPSGCSPKCHGQDSFGHHWTGCPGQTTERECASNKSQKPTSAKWYCQPSGHFSGDHPDMNECQSEWIGEIGDELSGDDPIPPENATNLLKKIETEMKEISYYGHEIKQILGFVDTIFKRLPSEIIPDTFEKLTNKSMDIGNEILSHPEPWVQIPQGNRSETMTNLFNVIQNNLFNLTKNVVQAGGSSEISDQKVFVRDKFNVGAGGGSLALIKDEYLTYPFNKYPEPNKIELPKDWADVFEGQTDNAYYQGVSMSRESLQNLLPNSQGFDAGQTSSSFRAMNTNLIGFSLASNSSSTNERINFPGSGVKILLKHEVEAWGDNVKTLQRKLHAGEKIKVALGSAKCVFWDTTKLKWSSEGCKLIKSDRFTSLCECSHLTNFAVLFDTHTYASKQFGLEILTIILCALSVLCLFTTIIIFTILRSMHSSRTTITKNLAICLLVGNSLVLLVMDKHYFDMSDAICTASGIVIHYAFLSAFMWMGIEGFYLYKLMIHVFDSGSNHLTMYRIMGYGLPLLIVGVTGTIGFLKGEDAYGGDMFCWLQGNYIWSFLVPAAIVVITNSIILFITLRTAYQVKTSTSTAQQQYRVKSYKTWARGCLSLSFLLGLTWTIGFLITIDNYTGSVVFAYIFTILNGAQGVFLFVFHCLLNDKVAAAAKRRNINLPTWLSASESKSGGANNTPSYLGSRSKTNIKTVFEETPAVSGPSKNGKLNTTDDLKSHQQQPVDGAFQTRRRSLTTQKEKDGRSKGPVKEDSSGGTISSVDSYHTSSTDFTSGSDDASSGGGSQKRLVAEAKRNQKY